jgi:hypothetical protein
MHSKNTRTVASSICVLVQGARVGVIRVCVIVRCNLACLLKMGSYNQTLHPFVIPT